MQGATLPIMSGVLIGYVGYDCIHYFLHHGGQGKQFAQKLKRAHMIHHYKQADSAFGISSPLVDLILGTQVF